MAMPIIKCLTQDAALKIRPLKTFAASLGASIEKLTSVEELLEDLTDTPSHLVIVDQSARITNEQLNQLNTIGAQVVFLRHSDAESVDLPRVRALVFLNNREFFKNKLVRLTCGWLLSKTGDLSVKMLFKWGTEALSFKQKKPMEDFAQWLDASLFAPRWLTVNRDFMAFIVEIFGKTVKVHSITTGFDGINYATMVEVKLNPRQQETLWLRTVFSSFVQRFKNLQTIFIHKDSQTLRLLCVVANVENLESERDKHPGHFLLLGTDTL